jgi:hypothetical protein
MVGDHTGEICKTIQEAVKRSTTSLGVGVEWGKGG